MKAFMRYRVLDTQTDLTLTSIDTNIGCVAGTSTVNSYAGKVGRKVETWDVVTPQYHKRIRAGELIVNPYKNVVTERFNSINGVIVRASTACSGNGLFVVQERDGPQLTSILQNGSHENGLFTPSGVLTQDRINQLLSLTSTQAYSRVVQADAQLLVILGELKKTLHDVKHPLDAFLKFLRKAKRDQLNAADKAKRLLTLAEWIQSEWLRYRFGIRPLISDIEGLLKAAGKDVKTGWQRALAKDLDQGTSTSSHVLQHGDVDTTYIEDVTDTLRVKVGLMFEAEVSPADFFGLNAKGIGAAAWELIPFSFVVDWLFNVGTYINTFNPLTSIPIRGRYSVVERVIVATRTPTGSVIARNTTQSVMVRAMTGQEGVTITSKTRSNTIPDPSLTSRINLKSFSFKDLRILDSVALAGQLLLGRHNASQQVSFKRAFAKNVSKSSRSAWNFPV